MSNTYTLYGTKGSGAAIVEAALVLAGARYEMVRASEWEADSAQAALRRLNPLGQIPTLVTPAGSVMTESAAIVIALGLELPAAPLLPSDAAARAQAIRGLVYIAANCYAAISIIDYPERWVADPDAATNDRIRAGTRARLHHHWSLFADQFPGRPWLSGERLGGLDVMAAVVSRWSGARAHLQRERPVLHALVERVDADAAVAPVFARHWPPKA